MFALIRHAGYHIGNGSLTEEGAQDIDKLAVALRNVGPWKEIRTSPSTRTRETAEILSEVLDIPMTVDERIGMDGDLSDLLPPTEPDGIVFVSHLPILSRWLRAWSALFGVDEPPLTEIACGYIVNTQSRELIPVEPLPKKPE